jgi:hypothetical protein
MPTFIEVVVQAELEGLAYVSCFTDRGKNTEYLRYIYTQYYELMSAESPKECLTPLLLSVEYIMQDLGVVPVDVVPSQPNTVGRRSFP